MEDKGGMMRNIDWWVALGLALCVLSAVVVVGAGLALLGLF